MSDMSVSAILHALSDETRLDMVRRLADSKVDMACGQLYEDLAKSSASYHFSILRNSGIIEQYEQSGRKFNKLRSAHIEAAAPGVLKLVLEAFRREHAGR
ncbi:MAG: helix-turn-helix transcriptional regulator [Rhodococcus sp.]|jgi:DNA-binding transcriptional ArsR family regulator|uniref:Unannotated protein n=1 Tax=freshwater metagenome TaxID=449393 RepID=A0A6J7EJ19_9ZZZZ|nr:MULTISPECIES: helix-turn-helix transcriptional regulator [Rhodococcus]MBJ7323803.1 helix-turn-helix transcriptional regulator [Rhodococcus sp. (in: high G+C Gram-positive bacteria)]MBW4779819.1 helix-turn-helix domain-containing protein [Rhodococcus fascians]MCX6489948.1 helix-turn-helix transcriptional regulator [Rhodococcus sp. (in: high G+C Gram-positive bacteria)]MDJ0002402.1 helix-turn-helix transcriptional regulator [Rhodococcus fascians]MDJ0426230.1 helix-turn-helix transcriptional r